MDALTREDWAVVQDWLSRFVLSVPAYDVDDVINRAMLSIWRNKEKVASREHLRPYLYRIVKNEVYSYWRRRKSGIQAVSAELESRPAPPETAECGWREQLLEAICTTLDADDAFLVCARFDAEPMPFSDICKQLDITKEAAYTRLHRALAKLRENLPPDFRMDYGVTQ